MQSDVVACAESRVVGIAHSVHAIASVSAGRGSSEFHMDVRWLELVRRSNIHDYRELARLGTTSLNSSSPKCERGSDD